MQNRFQNHFFKIKRLTNHELLSQTKFLVQKERDVLIHLLHHLAEIDSRKLYFKQGFSSLFDYAVRELGYSEGAAYRRIKAMKLCRDLPGTEKRLQSGLLSLSSACQLQVFFEKQAKKMREEKKKSFLLKTSEEQVGPTGKEGQKKRTAGEEMVSPEKEHKEEDMGEKATSPGKEELNNLTEEKINTNCQFLSQKEKENLVKQVEGCSRRATEKLLSDRAPSLSLLKEKTHFLGKGRVEIKMVINEECHKRLEKLKSLLSHNNPALSYGELLSILSEEGIKKHDPGKRNIRQRNQKAQIKVSPAKLKFKNEKKEQIIPLEKKEGQKSPLTKYQIKKINRGIPSWLKRYIWERDNGRCTYVHRETNRRCSSKHLLQIDHIQPFALGGKTEKENLRLLCAGHNRFRK